MAAVSLKGRADVIYVGNPDLEKDNSEIAIEWMSGIGIHRMLTFYIAKCEIQ